jgi:hypothetical protein
MLLTKAPVLVEFNKQSKFDLYLIRRVLWLHDRLVLSVSKFNKNYAKTKVLSLRKHQKYMYTPSEAMGKVT